MKKIILIGPFPPPVHGMAKNLKLFAEHVESKKPSVRINISPGKIERGILYHFNKVVSVLKGVFVLLLLSVKNKAGVVYMPPDAGFGAYYSLLFVIVAKVFSIPLYLHHRSFAYINKKTIGMALISLFEPDNTTHVFLCEKMKNGFEGLYGAKCRVMIVSNAQYVVPVDEIHNNLGVLTLGHLSNLGYEKGIKQVFEVCELLELKNIDFKLELGGPAENIVVKNFINKKVDQFKGKVNYHGLIGHNEKNEFYKHLDIFLFPTIYRNEAQPNVIFEANASGVPVFSLHTGCIPTDVDCKNGFVFESQTTFAEEAVDIIQHLISSRTKLNQLKQSTLEKITYESENSKSAYDELFNQILSKV